MRRPVRDNRKAQRDVSMSKQSQMQSAFTIDLEAQILIFLHAFMFGGQAQKRSCRIGFEHRATRPAQHDHRPYGNSQVFVFTVFESSQIKQ